MKTQRTNPREELNDLFQQIDLWATLMLTNLLWAILAVLLLPMPAATAGLFAVMSTWARGKQPEMFQEFFGAMRRLWMKATAIMLLNLFVGGLLTLNLSIFPLMGLDLIAFLARSVTLFVAIALMLVNLYLWSLIVLVDMPLHALIETSAKLAFTHPIWSLGVLIAAAIPFLVSLLLPQGVLVLFTFSCSAAIITKGTWHIIRGYLSEPQPDTAAPQFKG